MGEHVGRGLLSQVKAPGGSQGHLCARWAHPTLHGPSAELAWAAPPPLKPRGQGSVISGPRTAGNSLRLC